MQRRHGVLDRPAEIDVVTPIELGGQAGLDAHLGRPQLPGLAGPPDDLGHGQEVALLLAVIATERAERAVLDADVGEVDVAIDDERHQVADLPPAQLVGGAGERLQIAAAGHGQDQAVVDGHFVAVEGAAKRAAHVGRGRIEGRAETTSVASAHGTP